MSQKQVHFNSTSSHSPTGSFSVEMDAIREYTGITESQMSRLMNLVKTRAQASLSEVPMWE